MSPVYPAFCLLSCPHPPTRARRALFPAGRGRFLLSYARGFAPCIPGAGGARHWFGGRWRHPAGGFPGWSPVLPAVPASGGGLAVFVACLPCLLLAFLPPSPYPRSQSALPGGKGEIFVILLQGASPLASPGAGGARHWLGFEETIRFGIAGGRRLQLQSITNSRKVLGGLGASFKKPPTFLRSPVPSFSRS